MNTEFALFIRYVRQSATLLLAVLLTGCGFKYNDFMTEKIKESLGRQFREYRTFSYPTNNYGIMTVYTPEEDQAISDKDFFCDTWECLGVKPSGDQLKDLSVGEYVAVGEGGGSIQLKEKEQSELALKGLLPQIFQVIGVGAAYDRKRVVTTTLSLGRAYPRKLRRTRFLPYLDKLPPTDPLKQAFELGRLAVVVADVVVDGFSVTIQLDRETSSVLDAKLDPGVETKVFTGGSIDIRVGSSAQGVYTFDVKRPVIVMHLIKRQPVGGVLEAPSDGEWDDWPTATMKTGARE